MKMANYIAVCGSIGAGKTSLAAALAKAMGAQLLLEQVENSALLGDFYGDPETYALKLQLTLLMERSRKLSLLRPSDRLTVTDFVFETERVFAGINLKTLEHEVYQTLYERSAQLVPSPKKVVFIRAEVPLLLERIKQRGRPYERNIDPGDLERVTEGFEQMIAGYKGAPVLTVRAEETNAEASSPFMINLMAGLREGNKK